MGQSDAHHDGIAALSDAVEAIGVAPCDGCKHRRRCATGLACSAFLAWIEDGVSCKPRRPTEKHYREIYGPYVVAPTLVPE